MENSKDEEIEVFGRKYSKKEVHNKGIIDFDHRNFSDEEEKQIKSELIPIRGQIIFIQGKQKLNGVNW